MKEISVSEAYASNDRMREKFKAFVGSLTTEQLASRDTSQDKWTIAEAVEHVSLVGAGITGLCAKLLSKAQAAGSASNGLIQLSDSFIDNGEKSMTQKWQAPERVRPTGTQTIAESFAMMDDTRGRLEELRPVFEKVSSNETFPHPFLGELTAAEWLSLIGGHEARHLRQIKRILDS